MIGPRYRFLLTHWLKQIIFSVSIGQTIFHFLAVTYNREETASILFSAGPHIKQTYTTIFSDFNETLRLEYIIFRNYLKKHHHFVLFIYTYYSAEYSYVSEKFKIILVI